MQLFVNRRVKYVKKFNYGASRNSYTAKRPLKPENKLGPPTA